MENYKEKALKLLKEAEKKAAPGGLLSFFFGGTTKTEEAAECYQKAGNLFKITKSWENAADSFSKAAVLLLKCNTKHEAGNAYIDAGHAYKKFDIYQAETSYLKAIEIYLDMGRFTVAAKYHQTIAEMYEDEPMQHDKLIQHLEQASDYFRGEESNSCANRCLLKVALYSAEIENYQKAIIIYEQIAGHVLENSLLKYCAREYFFRSMLCHLCVDPLQSNVILEKYCDKFPAFADCREYTFLRRILESFEEHNVDNLTDAVKEFDLIQRLDWWYTMMLLRIKSKLGDKMDLR